MSGLVLHSFGDLVLPISYRFILKLIQNLKGSHNKHVFAHHSQQVIRDFHH